MNTHAENRDVLLWREESDQQIEALLEGLGYYSDYERAGQFRVLCSCESDARQISGLVIDALREPYPDIYTSSEWMVEPWPLEGVRWAGYGEEPPTDHDGKPYPYAVVVACPWRLGGREDFGDLVDRLLEDYGVESGRGEGERRWWVRYGNETEADPAALVSGLERTLGWWECYGLEFCADQAGDTVTLEINS